MIIRPVGLATSLPFRHLVFCLLGIALSAILVFCHGSLVLAFQV